MKEHDSVMSDRTAPHWIAGMLLAALLCASAARSEEPKFRRLPVREYRDKMKAGWIGQIIGVAWGAPTEGKFREIMPEAKMPPFSEDLVNKAFSQDDLYVEMTFLRTLEQYGMDVPIRQAGLDFANSEYSLWVANTAGRTNLRNGIAPPDSSHPKFHNCAGAIDYQIEADYSGLIAPGMPDAVIALGEKFGRLMNYGDGVYAGQFMGVLYAEAFFENDVQKLIAAGLRAIPAECMYAGMVRDMLRWHKENPNDWTKTWALVDAKYRKDKTYYVSPLDVKLEGAFVLMGLLYGEGDPDKTMIISCRCGSDSDCNPSSSGGIFFTARGVSKLPDRYARKLDEEPVFSHTAYNFPALLDVCEKLARQSLARAGGRVEKDANGDEVFVIPVKTPTPSRFEDLKNPGPVAGSLYSDAEMAKIVLLGLKWALPRYLPGWTAPSAEQVSGSYCRERDGRKGILELRVTGRTAKSWSLERKVEVPDGKKLKFRCAAGLSPKNEPWDLVVKADDKVLFEKTINKDSAKDGWLDVSAVQSGLPAGTVAVQVIGTPRNEKDRPLCYLADLAIAIE